MKKKDDSKIVKIQEATAQIILTEGIAKVSTVKVAKLVGIAQSNVYLYFKNKNDLLLSAYQRELDRIRDTHDLIALTDKNIPIERRIDTYIWSVYNYSIKYPDGLTIIEQIKSLNLTNEDVLSTNKIVITLLEEGISAGYLKDVPMNLHMSVVFNVFHQHALSIKDGLYEKDTYPFTDIAEIVLDALKK